MKIKTLFCSAFALFAGFALQANAEEITKSYPYGFIGAQGGVQLVTNGYAREHSFGDVITPVGSLYGGVQWTPVLGTRLHLNGWKGREGYKEIGKYYDFTYGTLTADLMVNVVNMFSHRDNNAFNVFLIGGFGGNLVSGDDWANDYNEYLAAAEYRPSHFVNGFDADADLNVKNRIAHAEKLGVALDYAFARNWSVNLEVDGVHYGYHDYVPEVNMSKDWQVLAQLGLTYRFGKCAAPAPAPVIPAPVQEPVKEEPVAPAPVEKPAPAPEPVKEEVVVPAKKEEKKIVVFYACAITDGEASEIAKVDEMVQWMKNHPTSVATVKGYADKGTGNPTINVGYAKNRAEKIAAMMNDKGIASSRLTTTSYGDTVQPFAENDKNRCVIVEAVEK